MKQPATEKAQASHPGNLGQGGWRLGLGDVHLWTISLDSASSASHELEGSLSLPELERAKRFRSDLHRNRFITARGLLRALLSRYLSAEPAELEFGYNPFGKPFLTAPRSAATLHFNLAHSENLALLAVTLASTVGVDVERIRPLTDAAQIASRFFSERESAAFNNLPPEESPLAFFKLWTGKEAWLKATGEGIGSSLNQVEVAFLPGDPSRFLSLPGDPQNRASWILRHFEPASGFIAALAIPAQATPLRCCLWNESATQGLIRQHSLSEDSFAPLIFEL